MTIDKEFKNSEEFQRLQNTVPAGAFGISEQGRRDAINNRVEAQTGMGPGQGTAITTEGSDEAVMNRSIWAAEQTGIPSGAELKAGSFGISAEGKEQAAANIAEFNQKKEKEAQKNKNQSNTKTNRPYRNPLRKIGGGRVLQYPIDLDTDIQDYFEIQVFKYRPAGNLPQLNTTNQGQNYNSQGQPIDATGAYASRSNLRGNRQNFRLQDLQSTIQIPIPPSIKDMNSVDFGGGSMSGLAGAAFSPVVQAFLNRTGDISQFSGDSTIRSEAMNFLRGIGGVASGAMGAVRQALSNPEYKRVKSLNAIAQALAAGGINVDVSQAITRVSGAVRNPNFELLFKGPSLRSFTFTIRLTPRDADESKRIRMIIRVLKQHSAVKRNAGVFDSSATSNFLLGTPDVFKLRYIKARTQRDIKGLNKFKTCALNSISVDYTGEAGRFAAYEEDSQPVTTLITLNFTELVPIYDEDYAEFTTDDDVGL
tara:strand:- start:501 stop:1937 length:1437 start_codon:yes stop_codon:yes gene_type:complete